MLCGKVMRVGRWSEETHGVLFIDVGDIDDTFNTPVSVHYRINTDEPYKVYRRGKKLLGAFKHAPPIGDALKAQLSDIITAATAYEQMVGDLEGFPEVSLNL